MRRRFGRRRWRGGDGGEGSAARPSIDPSWLGRIAEAGLAGTASLEPLRFEDVPESLCVTGVGEGADGGKVVVSFSPGSGIAALLGAAVTGARLAAEPGFRGRALAVAPAWRDVDRRALALLDGLPLDLAAVAAPLLAEEGAVDAEPRSAGFAGPPELAGAALGSAAEQARFERALAGLRGLAAKHGGVVRGAEGGAELVLLARVAATLRAGREGLVLEVREPARSSHPLAGEALAEALDRLEGQLRKFLSDRRIRESDEGLRGRSLDALAEAAGARAVRAWPGGDDCEAADFVAVGADGVPLVGAARRRLDLEALASVLEAALRLEPVLPLLLADVPPPVRLGAPALALAGAETTGAVDLVLGHLGLASRSYALRETSAAPELTLRTQAAGAAALAPRAPARPMRPAEPIRAEPPARLPEVPQPEEEADDTGDELAGAEVEAGETGEAGPRGRRRRRRRGGRRGRREGGEGAVEGERAEPESAESAPAPRPFLEMSLFDLDDESGEAGELRGRRRGRRGRRSRREASEPAAADDESEPAPEDSEDVEALLELSPDVPEVIEEPEPEYEEGEIEEPLSASERLRLERERRRRARLAAAAPVLHPADEVAGDAGDVEPELPRGRAAILAHADRASVLAALLLAREVRNIEGLWVYPQAELMTFFRGVATDLRPTTPIYLVGFEAKPSHDALQAAALYRGRLAWFDHHDWPPEDLHALRQAIGAGSVHVTPAAGSALPAVLALCGRRSRFTDKLVDLVTGSFSQHDWERWGRLWWHRLGEIAARPGEHRADLEPLLVGRPSDLARDAARMPPPPLPAEAEFAASRDFPLVHFGGYALVVTEVPAPLDAALCARILRERFGAALSLVRSEGSETCILGADTSASRALDVEALVEHLAQKLSFVEALADADHVARFRIRDLARHPERIEEAIAQIGMSRSVLEG
jgi:hypothetical protein